MLSPATLEKLPNVEGGGGVGVLVGEGVGVLVAVGVGVLVGEGVGVLVDVGVGVLVGAGVGVGDGNKHCPEPQAKDPQLTPHAPQLVLDVCRSTHEPAQLVAPEAHPCCRGQSTGQLLEFSPLSHTPLPHADGAPQDCPGT